MTRVQQQSIREESTPTFEPSTGSGWRDPDESLSGVWMEDMALYLLNDSLTLPAGGGMDPMR